MIVLITDDAAVAPDDDDDDCNLVSFSITMSYARVRLDFPAAVPGSKLFYTRK